MGEFFYAFSAVGGYKARCVFFVLPLYCSKCADFCRINFVEHIDSGLYQRVYLRQDGVYHFNLFVSFGIVDVNDMKQKVSFNGLFKG